MRSLLSSFAGRRSIIAFFLLYFFVTFCEQPERIVKINTLETAVDISYTSVTLKGEVTDLGSKEIEDHGILISENSTPRVGNARVESLGPLNKKGPFEISVTGLTKNTLYYFRAFVTVNGTDIFADAIFSFRTKNTEVATVTAGAISNVAMVSASLNGEVTSDGGEAVTKRGLCWSVNPTPVVSADTTACGSGTGAFSGNLKNLTPGTQYYVRTFAINAKGTSYSPADVIFTTHNYPIVTTGAVSAITNTGATSGGKVTSEGGVSVTEKGVVWGTAASPTIALPTKTSDGAGAGTFTSNITGLTPGASYFVRAYATNKYGTSYGNELQLTATKPSDVTTLPVELIGNTTAKIKGSVNPNGFAANVYFEYGTTALYGLLADAVPSPVSGSSAVTVSANLSGLLPGTEYHYRIKATNVGGTVSGADMTFITTDSPLPVTGSANTITNTTAVLTGSVNANGSSTSVSFELGTTTSYGTIVTATPGTVTGNSSTTVSGNATGLLQGTTYHYRVKAVSVGGTTYGNDITFTTTKPPDATTSAATSVQNTSATLNGSVNPYDLSTIVTFEYGETTSYGTSVSATESPVSGSSSVNVSKSITGLNPGKTYHFRVKAESSAGAVYGSDLSFKTPEPPLAATDAATTVGTTIATLNGTVNAKDLNATVTFQYGPTTSYGTTVNATPGTVTGSTATAVSYNLTGLTQGTTYHFRVVAASSGGISNGSDQTFTTSEPPVAVTGSASPVAATTATLGGTVNAKGLTTAVTFEYGTTTSYGMTASAAESPLSGNTNIPVTAAITSLTAATTYHFRVKATSATGTAYGDDGTFTTTDLAANTVTDYDGNVYNTVQIGTQLWMKENLRATKYSDGSPITDYRSYADNASNLLDYGYLYNWNSVVRNSAGNNLVPSGIQGVCPVNWHVPSLAEWQILYNYLNPDAGGKLKEAGITYWSSPNTGATNESGFSARPGGYLSWLGYFETINVVASFWTTTKYDSDHAWAFQLGYNSAQVSLSNGYFSFGFSIRCIKD